jgi:glycine cleavage system H protein
VRTIGEMRFSQDHFWVRLDDETQATIGLTDYLQERLGEIYGLRLPEEGEEFIKDEPFTLIEAKNGRRELKAPISGEVMKLITRRRKPKSSMRSPDGRMAGQGGDGFRSEFDDLFTEEEYEDHLKEEEDLEETEPLPRLFPGNPPYSSLRPLGPMRHGREPQPPTSACLPPEFTLNPSHGCGGR